MIRLVLLIGLLCFPLSAAAQQAATLIADQVFVESDNRLIARGNVEAFFGDDSVRASEIIYDRDADRLIITGPIVVTQADGSVLTAERGELDPQLENGILQGARIVLADQVQLAANQIGRQDGRYLQLYRTTASSCQVCGDHPPLWSIRAQEVIHDREEQQLYFRNSFFLLLDVPIFWIPQMRLPDPTLDRATGLLIPSQVIDNQLGTGYKIPYFITLGDHRDLTVTPFLSPETRTLELRYRQALVRGDIEVNGAVSDDTLLDERRSYLFADGRFRLNNDFRLSFDIESTSDRAYLATYGYSGKDRLDSAIDLLRVRGDHLFDANLTYFQTLRDDEVNDTLPPVIGAITYQTKRSPSFGGILSYGFDADAGYRTSDVVGDDGRDVFRAGAWGNWYRDWIAGPGLVATFEADLRTDIYNVDDDPDFDNGPWVRAVPTLDATLRWPWSTQTATGSAHIIEPVAQIAMSESFGDTPPNEDSTRNEFDQGNLLALSRFTGEDAVETGIRGALGGSWTRLGAAGTSSTLSFGRVYRDADLPNFTPSSGLGGTASDWLVGGQLQTPNGLAVNARAIFNDDTDVSTAEGLVGWSNRRIDLFAAYFWQEPDTEQDRTARVSDWRFNGTFEINDAITIGASGRYNIAEDRPLSAGLDLQWQNECVTIDLSVSRRFTASRTVDPTTTFSISGSVDGFSLGRSNRGPATQCAQ